MIHPRIVLSALALAGLVACGGPAADLAALGEPEVTRQIQEAPPGAPPGTCWGKHVSPAVIETVTEQILLQPAEVHADGTVTRPAVYKTETVQKIVRERRETWFETPCAQDLTPEFLASLQRALAVRGHFKGAVTGQMDARTRAAVRRYQKPQGLDSGILSLAAARKLGLVAVERNEG
ncbi:peptidoglycan-binding domain-containing protein [Antarcticimicrobium luteum]|uniref:Peptidoglycan-binding protein n=1 Tax=Antarcticimicrobium luteum TaxID=2547397 RepID=A0A4R5UV39_9RHOB|nr:peptidoglycan-binding domain-containing protein [Antarcticimicrobium luteum]TDK43100.1 peptidoglycan-binding protein [Antarcticimicrobium luteum]